jgi:hypothetical protein
MVLLAGAAVLAVSGCGSSGHSSTTGTPASVVQGDVSRLDRAFHGWRRLPPIQKRVCPDTAGGPLAASASRNYIYPPHQDYGNIPYPYNEVIVQAGYRTDAAHHVAAYARPDELRCTHTAVVKFLHRLTRGDRRFLDRRICISHGHCLHQPKRFTRCCSVRITPGLPSWLVGVVGRNARGYREVDNPLLGFPWIYKLAVMYPDRGNPHVTRLVYVAIANKTRVKFPNADAVLRRLALRAIRATG